MLRLGDDLRVWGSALALPDIGYADLDRDVGPVDLDTVHYQAATDNGLSCSLEEAVFDSGHEVFPTSPAVHKECDTFPARPHDPAGYFVECC